MKKFFFKYFLRVYYTNVKCVRQLYSKRKIPHSWTLRKNTTGASHAAFQISPVFFSHAISFTLTFSETHLCYTQVSVNCSLVFSQILRKEFRNCLVSPLILQMKNLRATDMCLMPCELLAIELELRVYIPVHKFLSYMLL